MSSEPLNFPDHFGALSTALSFTAGKINLGFYPTELNATSRRKYRFYKHPMEVIALGDDISLPKYVSVGRPRLLDDRTPL